jgi:hypothetical protein
MSQITKTQGPVKLSEVAVDTNKNGLVTLQNEDALTVIEQMRRVVSDAFRRSSATVLSSGNVKWDTTNSIFFIPNGVKLIYKVLLNDSNSGGKTINIEFTGSNLLNIGPATLPSGTNITITANQCLYIQLDRSILDAAVPVSGVSTVALDLSTTGQKLAVQAITSTPWPKLRSDMSDNKDSTLLIPLIYRPATGSGIYWANNGVYWSGTTQAVIGSVSGIGGTLPIGTIMPFHYATGPVTEVTLASLNPNWWPCNGSQINNLSSSLHGYYAPNLNANYNSTYGRRAITASYNNGSNIIFGFPVGGQEYLYVGQRIYTPNHSAGTTITGYNAATGEVTVSNFAAGGAVGVTIYLYFNMFLRGNKSPANSTATFDAISKGSPSSILNSYKTPNHTHLLSNPVPNDHGHGGGYLGDVSTPHGSDYVQSGPGNRPDVTSANATSITPFNANFNSGNHTHIVTANGVNYPQHSNQPAYADVVYMIKIL